MQIGGMKRPFKEHLLELCDDQIVINELIEGVNLYLKKYIDEIHDLIDAIQAKGFDINEIRFLSNMLEKSSFLKIKPNNR